MPNLLKSFAPWVVFFALLGPSTSALQLASILALVSHIALNKQSLKQYFVFDIGGLICFALFALCAFLHPAPIIIDHAGVILNAAMALIAWVSLVIKRPFTLQYARAKAPRHTHNAAAFIRINYLLTLLWALLLSLMLLPNLIEQFITWQYDTGLNIIVTIGLIFVGIWLTNTLPLRLVRRSLQKHLGIDIKALYRQHHTPAQGLTQFQTQQLQTQCDHSVEVLVVGAGPVGLATALLLQQHGIDVVVIEKHPGVSIHPKARGVSCRSMELFRKLGIEAEIKQNNLPEAHTWFGWFSTLTGTLYGRITRDIAYDDISPCQPGTSAQPFLEQAMLQAFQARGGTVLFEHKVTNLAQDQQQAQIWVEDLKTQQLTTYQTHYVVAADGSRSSIRQLLDIPLIGPDNLSNNLSVYCEMDLYPLLDKAHRFGIAYVMEESGPAPMIISIDGQHRWVVVFPSGGGDLEAFKALHTDDFIKQRIHRMIGREDIAITILSKQYWQLSSQVANQFSAGRTYLAGDSIHQFSPTGGMGMNTGLQDADNLAWKLAYVIQNKANPALLNSYETEMLPVILERMDWSLNNLMNIVTLKQELAQKSLAQDKADLLIQARRGHINKSGLDLGVIYQSSCIASNDQPRPYIDYQHYENLIYPGGKLPHIALKKGRKMLSTLDLVSTDFILLCSEASHPLAQAINFKSLTTQIIALGGKNMPKEVVPGQFQALMNSTEHAAVWVRPDGHITWCGNLDQQNDIQQLQAVINTLNC